MPPKNYNRTHGGKSQVPPEGPPTQLTPKSRKRANEGEIQVPLQNKHVRNTETQTRKGFANVFGFKNTEGFLVNNDCIIEYKYNSTSPRVTIKWNRPAQFLLAKERECLTKSMVVRIETSAVNYGARPVAPVEVPGTKTTWILEVEQGSSYEVNLKLMCDTTGEENSTKIAEAWVAVFPKNVVDEFKQKQQFHNFSEISRSKMKKYWDDVGTELLKKHEKDDNGHSENGINGELEGIFFLVCKPNYEQIPSLYGDRMVVLKADAYLNPNTFNWYLGDIYCYSAKNSPGKRTPHYVNVVVSKKGSPSDRDCIGRLLPLVPKENPFVTMETTHRRNAFNGSTVIGRRYQANEDLWVELFITEDIAVTKGQGKWKNVACNGQGYSTPGTTKPVNNKCPTCLLYYLKYLGKM